MKTLAAYLLALSLAACSPAFAQSEADEGRAVVQCSALALDAQEIYTEIQGGREASEVVLEIVQMDATMERKTFLLRVVQFVQENRFTDADEITMIVYTGCMRKQGYEGSI